MEHAGGESGLQLSVGTEMEAIVIKQQLSYQLSCKSSEEASRKPYDDQHRLVQWPSQTDRGDLIFSNHFSRLDTQSVIAPVFRNISV